MDCVEYSGYCPPNSRVFAVSKLHSKDQRALSFHYFIEHLNYGRLQTN